MVKNNPLSADKAFWNLLPTGVEDQTNSNRHSAASRSANPFKTAQHSLLGFVPITSCTIPSQSPHTPNLSVSLGHFTGVEGGTGAGFGVGGGHGAGFGVGGGTGTGSGGHGALVDETQVKNAMLSRIRAPTGFRPAIDIYVFLSLRGCVHQSYEYGWLYIEIAAKYWPLI
ncbi:hypothetical protein OROHE_008064 [Orobanche hederae]